MNRPELVPFTVRIPRRLHERLRAKAERERSSMNRETTFALEAHLSTTKRGNTK